MDRQRMWGLMLQKHVVDPLMAGSCGMSEDELLEMVSALCHVERNIDETCRLCNNCDPKTLKRWEEDEDVGFPHHHKDPGGKIYWWLDEVELWKQDHGDVLERVARKRKNRG